MPEAALVLVVDDDRSVASLLETVLQEEFRVRSANSASAALDIVQSENVAVVLADQRMPGMNGIDLLSAARTVRPTLVGVLITGHADVDSAIKAINDARVLGFLTKPWDEQELFDVMRRAVDAHHALRHLLRASAATERELRLFEDIVDSAPAPTTAHSFGNGPLRTLMPDEFAALAATYGTIVMQALEDRVYRVDHPISERLRQLAQRLGALNAGPRDVIDLHVTAFKQQVAHSDPNATAELADIGRLLVLELMGDVVSFYRSYTVGVRS